MRSLARWLLVLMTVVLAAPSPPRSPRGVATVARTVVVEVRPNGSFEPSAVSIHVGDTVVWRGLGRTDAIVRVPLAGPGQDVCDLRQPHDPFDVNEFTGPIRVGVPGIFVRGPGEAGRGPIVVPADTTCSCELGGRKKSCVPEVAGGFKFCSGEASQPSQVLEEIWSYPEITGALVLLAWNRVEPSMDRYDWSELDHELTAAATHGKSLSLAIGAGVEGLPGWLFKDGGVAPVATKDTNDGDPRKGNCGISARMASPSDDRYREHWNDLLADLAAHIRTDAAWWQSVHQIKLGGLNNVSDEAKLPKSCLDEYPKDGVLDTIEGDPCVCNPQVWGRAGYTPAELYEFYAVQEQAITTAFGPGMTMGFPLIQAGFPRTVSATNFRGDILRDQRGVPLQPGGSKRDDIDATEQTEIVVARGLDAWGNRFVPFHNGLGRLPEDDGYAGCSYGAAIRPASGAAPARAEFPIPRRGRVKGEPGCPNEWVTNAGLVEDHMTGFQTNNQGNGVNSPGDVESTLWNLTKNSNAVLLEIYSVKAWLIHHTIGPDRPLDPGRAQLPPTHPARTSKSMNAWNNELVDRRAHYPGDPFPTEWSHTFTALGTFGFYNPVTCSRGRGRAGSIEVSP